MTGKKYFLLFTFSISMFLNSILFAEEYPVAGSKIKICILSYDTEFKKNMTEALVQDFNLKSISVTVDSFSNSSKYNAVDYDAIILFSGAFMFSPRSKAVKFIKANNYSANIIYVFTSDDSPYGNVLDKNKIDAISCASVEKNNKVFDKIKNKIIKKVLEIINSIFKLKY